MSAELVVARLRQALASRDDVRLGLLFGSRARGTAREGSDVDVAFSGDADPLDLARDLSLALGMEVDVLPMTDDLGVPLLEALVRDGIVVHEGARGAAAQWRSHALSTLETDRPGYARMRDAWLSRVAERGLPNG